MNRIYKVIWSRTKNCYVVVSELVKSHTRSSSRSGRRAAAVRVGSAILLGIYLAAGCSLPLAWADIPDNPTQEEINEAVVKTKGITREGRKTTIEQDETGSGGFNIQTNFNSGASNGYMNVYWGQGTLATGANATAWGISTFALSPRSTAWGNEAKAKGDQATAFGSRTTAYGINSTAWGADTVAFSHQATAFGEKTTAGGQRATAWGLKTTAGGDSSTAYGNETSALMEGATAWGNNTKAGRWTYTDNNGVVHDALVIQPYVASNGTEMYEIVDAVTGEQIHNGENDYIDAYNWLAAKGTVKGVYSTAWGNGTEAEGDYSTAFGNNTTTAAVTSLKYRDPDNNDWTEAKVVSKQVRVLDEHGNPIPLIDPVTGEPSDTEFQTETKYAIVDAADPNKELYFSYFDTEEAAMNEIALEGKITGGYGATAFGLYSEANGAHSTAFGIETVAEGTGATAWGRKAQATGDYSTAWGFNTEAINDKSTAFGDNTIAGGKIATAWGYETAAGGRTSTAFGSETVALTEGATAWGNNTKAGKWTYAGHDVFIKKEGDGRYHIVDEYGNSGSNGLPGQTFVSYDAAYEYISSQGTVKGVYATAWGNGTKAEGDYSTAWGKDAIATGNYATAIGAGSEANGENSIALGGAVDEDNSDVVASSVANGRYSVAVLGGTTGEEATNSLAIGRGAQATLSDSVALGSGSVADREKYDETGNPYQAYLNEDDSKTNPAWRATHNAIAIGASETDSDTATVTRQITGVAAGTYDTDAVNVAQLKSVTKDITVETAGNYIAAGTNVAGNLTALDTQVKANAEAVATKAESADITVGTAGNYIAAGTNVASNLTALDTQVKANADAIQAGNEALTTKGITFKGDTGTSGAVKLDGELAVKGDSNIATTASAGQLSLSLNKDVNLGSTGSMTVGKSVINDSGLVITDGTQVTSVTASGINAGSNRITNVANGTDTNDAVNYGQLMTAYALGSGQLVGVGDGLSAANGEFSVNAGGGLTFGENGQLQVNAGDDLSVDADGKLQVKKGGEVASGNTGLVTGGTVYTALEGVKSATETALAGKADKATTLSGYGITDAYTKAETDTQLSQKADKADSLSGYGIKDAYTKAETDTQLSQKADKADSLSGYGIKDAYTKTETDTQLSQKADKADSLSGYGIKDAYTKTETDTQLSQKADKANTLKGYGIEDAYSKEDTDTLLNKKADQTALDAVKATADSNKAALESLGLNSSESTNGEDTGITLGVNTTKIAVGKGSVASGNEAISIGNAVGDQKNIASGSESIAIGFGNQVTGNHSGAFGDPNEVSGNASYAFGNDNTVSADKTFVLGNNVTASGTNSVVLGDGSDGSERNVVSVGADGNERRITHVAAGQNATDAATVGQVNSVAQSINNLDSRINKVGAGAAALAALHPTDQDGKFGVGVGYGNYHSANAVAMGLFYRPTDNMMMSLGGTVGNGENMVNVGLSIALDKPAPNSKQAMTKKIAVQEAQLAQQGEKLAAQDAELKAQKKEIEALKEALQRLEAKISG